MTGEHAGYVTDEQIEAIAIWAAGAVPAIRRCWVYGSRAGSTFRQPAPRPDSDLDVAVELVADPCLLSEGARMPERDPDFMWAEFEGRGVWGAELSHRLGLKVQVEIHAPEPWSTVPAQALAPGLARLCYGQA